MGEERSGYSVPFPSVPFPSFLNKVLTVAVFLQLLVLVPGASPSFGFYLKPVHTLVTVFTLYILYRVIVLYEYIVHNYI